MSAPGPFQINTGFSRGQLVSQGNTDSTSQGTDSTSQGTDSTSQGQNSTNPAHDTSGSTNPNNFQDHDPSTLQNPSLPEDEDGLRAMMGDAPNANRPPITSDQHKLSKVQMEQFATLELDALRVAANTHAIHRRMTEEMREEIDEMYYEFQCNVTKLAIQNRVASHLYFEHLGQNRKVRAGTSWNNFQKYDPAVQRLFDEFGREIGGVKVSELWGTKSWPEKLRYRDMDYLKTLHEVTTEPSQISTDVPNPAVIHHAPISGKARLNGRIQASKYSQKQTLTLVTDWVGKIEKDFQSLAFFHQIEGFLVVASRHPKSTIFRKVGTPMGNGFLGMLATDQDNDTAAEFHTWVAAQAIQVSKGCVASVPQKRQYKPTNDEICEKFRVGKHKDNIRAIREQLRQLIHIASKRKCRAAWPGEDTDGHLRELKMSVEIDENDWHLELEDLKKPLARLDNGVALAVLACLGLNKIHITHHPEWPDCPRKRHKKTRKSKNAQQNDDENDDDSDHGNSSADDSTDSGNQPPRKKTRTVKRINPRDPHPKTPSTDANATSTSHEESREQSDGTSLSAPAQDTVLDPLLEALA
ncbi:hypothetical protein PGT21_012881 [Puccinia graminis f. sp. tritici]|uniref:Uncharacterized protein n=1 Tax=Puccinia graminis f. sp. tritici TaxID=56615 RepID=A0A5B0R146_PUCGR|nr:hypothetical protein PGTUg99_012236 [Puccinia graminis f. sp. tritici]KAA1119023.1 hypothetical protein PGT21_012881 [Puccinia graminis f. sp. tritici]